MEMEVATTKTANTIDAAHFTTQTLDEVKNVWKKIIPLSFLSLSFSTTAPYCFDVRCVYVAKFLPEFLT